MRVLHLLPIIMIVTAFGCAGMNPNPGERSADMAWERGDYNRAHSFIRPAAERGEPWAQLRLGVAYELGIGVPRNLQEAIFWYKKAALQMAPGEWAEGKIIGATGEPGYFNQNSDALIAQHQLANIYLRGDGVQKDLIEAYLLEKNVSDETKGRDLFYCCEFSNPRFITANDIAKTLHGIEMMMTINERKIAEEKLKAWRSLQRRER